MDKGNEWMIRLTSWAKLNTSCRLSKNSKVAASLSGRLSYAFSSQEAISCLAREQMDGEFNAKVPHESRT